MNKLIEQALDAVVGIDADENIICWNKMAEKIFGWPRDEVIGKKSLLEFIPQRFHSDHLRGIKGILRTRKSKVFNNRRLLPALRRDGTEFPAEMHIIPLLEQERIEIYAFLRDISEQKKWEAEQKRLNLGLQTALRHRDLFLSMASHELKTPLTALKLRLQLAQLATDDLEVSKSLAVALRQVDRFSVLINDLLDLTRIQAGRLEMTFKEANLSRIIGDAAADLSSELATSNCALKLNIPESNKGFWDPVRLGQVFVNLMSNCVKYAPGNPIEITVKNVGSDMIEIYCCDNGPGIPEDMKQKVFAAYERGHAKSSHGLGLGLFICKNIITSHGGEIAILDSPKKGAAIKIVLPRDSRQQIKAQCV